jgi:hypothetical protein
MNAKSIITPLLLLFVGGSVAYLVVGETRSNCCAPPSTVADATVAASGVGEPVGPAAQQSPDIAAAAAAPSPESHRKTIAYYFHSTQRCRTCLTIERQTQEALTETFAAELDSGALEWHALNVDEPANEHFIKSYELVASSLVLVNQSDGAEQSWANLDQVWDFVNDEPAFKRYVAEQARAYLEQ